MDPKFRQLQKQRNQSRNRSQKRSSFSFVEIQALGVLIPKAFLFETWYNKRMRKAYIVIGLGFGDESKGATVSAITRRMGAQLVVRFNGGAQAAHTVVWGSKKHTFHQFGSGTFSGAKTHLSKFHLFNPIALLMESNELRKKNIRDPLSLVSVSPDARLVTPYHVYVGRLRELINKHGSCGQGIGECMMDEDCPTVSDFMGGNFSFFDHRSQMQERFREIEHLASSSETLTNLRNLMYSGEELEASIQVFEHVLKHILVTKDDNAISWGLDRGHIVFEGAQGVLLDQDYGFHPHTTWSTTTDSNARSLLLGHVCEVVTVGCIRAHASRHGNGPLPTEDESLPFADENNPENQWQGKMRFGHLDALMTKYAISICSKVDCISMSHLDEPTKIYCWSYGFSNGKTEGTIKDWIVPDPDDLDFRKKVTRFFKTVCPNYSMFFSKSSMGDLATEFSEIIGVPIGILAAHPDTQSRVFMKGFFEEDN